MTEAELLQHRITIRISRKEIALCEVGPTWYLPSRAHLITKWEDYPRNCLMVVAYHPDLPVIKDGYTCPEYCLLEAKRVYPLLWGVDGITLVGESQ